jgi:hypothetical protein
MKVDMIIPLKVTESKNSRNKDGKYVTITFYEPSTNRTVKTHCVSTYGNFVRWKKVINYDFNKGTMILKSTSTFKFTDADTISADSTFSMHEGVSWDAVADIVEGAQQRLSVA